MPHLRHIAHDNYPSLSIVLEGIVAVRSNYQRLEAGLVYLMAMALQRRCPGHPSIEEASNWLGDRGHVREARLLSNSIDMSAEPWRRSC
ncbi:MAG: hypothetical protein HOB79_06235 [Rhodospirillaceae bacterium]|nr:hypothetical protein [Rhodospirillaceae bacterium]